MARFGARYGAGFAMVGVVRLVVVVIVAACAIAVLLDTPRRELESEIDRQWQEYREHVGETTPAQ